MFYTILLFVILNGILYVAIYKLIAWFSSFFAIILGFLSRVQTTSWQLASPESSSPCSLGSPMRASWKPFRCRFCHPLSCRIFGIVNVPRKWYAVVYLILISVHVFSYLNGRYLSRESASLATSVAWSPASSLRRDIWTVWSPCGVSSGWRRDRSALSSRNRVPS